MQLHAEPLATFAHGDSPLSLHVRLHYGAGGMADRDSAARQRAAILAQQDSDGRWKRSTGHTVNALFQLWLLDQQPCSTTARGVDALLEAHYPLPRQSQHPEYFDMLSCHVSRGELAHLNDVPFTMGCSLFVKSGAALFFAAKFGQGDAARIAAARRVFDLRAKDPLRRGCWCSGPCANNVVQGYAASPDLACGPAMRLVVSHLAAQQRPSGEWGSNIPFYPTCFALAQVPGGAALRQLKLAAAKLVKTQNRDGTWGRSKRELNTFLVLDALQRVGMLKPAVAAA